MVLFWSQDTILVHPYLVHGEPINRFTPLSFLSVESIVSWCIYEIVEFHFFLSCISLSLSLLQITGDYSRMTWVYLFKSKADTFAKFQEWCTEVENRANHKVKTLRSNNGKEFVNSQFDTFCKKTGIRQQLSTPYIPQQNGVIKRKNRTISFRFYNQRFFG